jgi:hypothetical protein
VARLEALANSEHIVLAKFVLELGERVKCQASSVKQRR